MRLTHEGLSGQQEVAHAEGWNHYLDRLVAEATNGDAGADEWAAAPDPVNELIAADATLAVLERVLRSLNLEFLVHAWDFSKALGADLSVSDALTDYVEVLAQQTISDQVRAGGSFAPARQVAESASSLERLVAFTGRPVHV